MMGTWKLHGGFFKLGPQKGLNKGRTPYYFQFVQHHFKVWFCTITLFVLFHVHAFIYYHIKILFKQVFALHILCSYLLFWFYIIGFRFRPPFAIVYLGHYVPWKSFCFQILFACDKITVNTPNATWWTVEQNTMKNIIQHC
jgi:hypothetical protein